MLTCILRRDAEPNVIQLTQENIMRGLSDLNHSEMLLENTWAEGIRKVRTPYFCLLEADCTLSGSYLSSNLGLMKKDNHSKSKGTGGYTKRAMLASCIGAKSFANRIYNYQLDKQTILEDPLLKVSAKSWQIGPNRKKLSTKPYHVQVGFVPGAIIRHSSIKDIIDTFNWDDKDLVKMSTKLSFHLWDTGRRIQVNPNTTYVSNSPHLEEPPLFEYQRPDRAINIFNQELIGVIGV